MVTQINCKGSLKVFHSCGRCERCLINAKKIVEKYRTVPIDKIPEKDFMNFILSIGYLYQMLGFRGQQEFIRPMVKTVFNKLPNDIELSRAVKNWQSEKEMGNA